MKKYAVLVVLDLDVEVLPSTPIEDVTSVTKKRLQILINGNKNLKIEHMRAVLMRRLEKE